MNSTRLRWVLAAVAILVIAIYLVTYPGHRVPLTQVTRPSTEPILPATNSPAVVVATPAPPVEANAAAADPDLAVFLSAEFKRTSVHQRWAAQGVTEADIAGALAVLRRNGFSGAQLRDPNLVSQFLPARNIEPVYVEEITLPATVAAGESIPFRLKANFPSPAFSFEKWDIRTEAQVVIVRPVGARTADPVAAVVVPVDLEGNLPGLDRGDYVVRFEAIGEPVERALAVR